MLKTGWSSPWATLTLKKHHCLYGKNYTRNGWRRCENTLETSGEDQTNLRGQIGIILGVGRGEFVETLLKGKNNTRNEWRRCKTTLEASGEDKKLHSKRVERMFHFFGRVIKESIILVTNIASESTMLQTTLQTSGEDVNYTRNESRRFKSTLETSGEDVNLHSKRVEKM